MLLHVVPKSMHLWEWRPWLSPGVLTIALIKGMNSADKCGCCCQAAAKKNQKQEQDGEVERCSMAINTRHHQNMVLLTLQPLWWRRDSMVAGEGAAPAPAVETWGWNTASLSGAESMEGHRRVTLTSRAQRSNVSHLSWPRVQVF